MILSAIISAIVSIASLILFPFHAPAPVVNQINQSPLVSESVPVVGNATNPIAGTAYTLSGSGVSSAATSIVLTSLTIPQTGYLIQDSDLSSTFYITLEPGNRTKQEIVSCTTVVQNGNGTATLSGCARGLLPFSPFTASSTYAFAHGGGTTVVFSNPPQLYDEFTAKGNSATITGVWKFASSSIPRASSTPTYTSGDELKFVTYGQLASTTFSGTVDCSETQKGVCELATIAETASGASAGSTTAPLIPQNKYFNQTFSATTTIPVTGSNGKLSINFIATSTNYAFSNQTISVTTATSTATSTDSFNLLPAGVEMMYASSTAPAGWLLENGTEYATSSYPRLFAVIGYLYGGSTSTFKVPDNSGRFVAAPSSTLSTTIGATGGYFTTSTPSIPLNFQNQNVSGGGGSGINFVINSPSNGTTTITSIPQYIIKNFIIKY